MTAAPSRLVPRGSLRSAGADLPRCSHGRQAPLILQEHADLLDDLGCATHLRPVGGGTGVVQEAADDEVDADRLTPDGVEELRVLPVLFGPFPCDVHETHDRRQGISDLVCYPGGKRSDRGQARGAGSGT